MELGINLILWILLMQQRKILIATGGTGGHIFPALALKKELENQGAKVQLTADGKFTRYHPFDENHIFIPASSFNSKSFFKIIIILMTLIKGFLKSLCLIYKQKPEIVIGFGGYASFPTILAAIVMRKTIILHEANIVIGKVNRLLLWSAKYLTTGFATISGVKPKYKDKIIYTGNPVRGDIVNTSSVKSDERLVLLIIGGSQGAKIFSRIIPEMVINLPAEIKAKLCIYQQVKEEDVERIKEIYTKEAIECEINSFFTDMNDKLNKANLVIARSGASTIAELITTQVPAILIPLLSSADNHQYYNAKAMTEIGASWLVIEEPSVQSSLLKIVKAISKDPSLLSKRSEKLKSLQQDASKNIAKMVFKA